MNVAYNMDCLEAMKSMPDNAFDLAVVDPVYGDVTGGGYTTDKYDGVSHHIGNCSADEIAYHRAMWRQPKTPPEYFKELFRVSKNQVIWGGNFFTESLPSSQGWIVWDKKRSEGLTFSDCELAFTSFNVGLRIFRYRFDHEAIQEEAKQEWLGRYKYGFFNGKQQENFRPDGASNTAGIKKPQTKHKNLQENGQQNHSMHERRAQGLPDEQYAVRNKRDVWTVTTKPYSGAHFATYPEDLIKPCILAGSREGDLVLDPFNGAATTGVVCKRLKRDYLGIELNPEYIKLSNDRLEQVDREMYMELNQFNLFD